MPEASLTVDVLVPLLVSVGALPIVGLTYAWLRRSPRAVARRFACPGTGEQALCLLMQDPTGPAGRFAGARSCSVLSPRERVTCSETCVSQLNRGVELV